MRAVLFITLLLVACSEDPCRVDYGSCESSEDCNGESSCETLDWAFGGDAICSEACEDELDCPRTGGRAGRCIDVNRTGDFRCYQPCATDAACPTDWVCQPVRSGGVVSGICLP